MKIKWLEGCARCKGEGHAGLDFKEFTHPFVIEVDPETEWSHWAMCPTVNEPILMAVVGIAVQKAPTKWD